MEETMKKQIKSIQAMTTEQRERFLRIYFYESEHSVGGDCVLTADPE